MTGDTWFSSRLRFAIIIETLGPVRYDDSVYLLRSTDFEDAFQRALETGRKNQKEYLNGDGQKVNATRFSNTGNRLRQLWGRPPGLRGSSRTRSSRNGTSHIRARRGRRGRRPQEWSPAPRITQLAQNRKTSDIRLQPVSVASTASPRFRDADVCWRLRRSGGYRPAGRSAGRESPPRCPTPCWRIADSYRNRPEAANPRCKWVGRRAICTGAPPGWFSALVNGLWNGARQLTN